MKIMRQNSLFLLITTILLATNFINCQWRTEYNLKQHGRYDFKGEISVLRDGSQKIDPLEGRLDISTSFDVENEKHIARFEILGLEDPKALYSAGILFDIDEVSVDSATATKPGKYYEFDTTYHKQTTDSNLKSTDDYTVALNDMNFSD